MPRKSRGLTLIELLIALVLLSLVVLGFSSIVLFSRYHVISADRRAKLQNNLSYILEHMTKQIAKAIGNEKIDLAYSVIDERNSVSGVTDTSAVRVYVDGNLNGQRDTVAGSDYWKAYRFRNYGGQAYSVNYCLECLTKACSNANCAVAWETLGNNITNFSISKPANADNTLSYNYVDVDIAARWFPGQPVSVDNPEINMRTRIKMPSVSTN